MNLLENTKISRRTALTSLAGLVFGGLPVFGEESREKKENLEDYAGKSIKEYVTIASLDALKTIGFQGGYFDSKGIDCYMLDKKFIPVYFNENSEENKIVIPSKEKIEESLSNQINKNLRDYLENLKDNGFNLNYSGPASRVWIRDNQVNFAINLPVVIRRQKEKEYVDKRIDLKNHTISHRFPLLESLEIARYIVKSRDKDSDVICISELTDMVRERDLHVGFYELNRPENFNGELVQITESKKEGETAQIYLQFLNKFREKAPRKLPGF